MSGVVVPGKVEKIVNKGGGRKCRTVRLGGGRYTTYEGPREKGTDYVVFNCPACGARNRKSAYDAKGASGDSIAFKCHKCYREVMLDKPLGLVVPTIEKGNHGLVDVNGNAIRS